MPTANAMLLDRQIDHAIDLRRYSDGVLRRMIALLNRSDARLTAQLTEALMRVDRSTFTVERLEALLASVRATNAAAYAEVFGQLRPELEELAELEVLAQTRAMTATVPGAVLAQVPLVEVVGAQVYAAAVARPFQGRLLAGWASNVEAGRMTLIRNAIRAGVVEGRTTSEIITSLRGTKALQFNDGLLNRSRRELATIVQTAVAHTAQTARREFYKANDELIEAVVWVSTLDNRTSEECAIRDGLEYTVDGEPIGHAIPWLEGPGRLHFNCRSVDAPVTKSWRELGIDADELSPAARASMDGQVPGETTYGDWLLRQSAERQNEILGAGKAELLRSGGLKLPDLYDGKGSPLTLRELRAKLG